MTLQRTEDNETPRGFLTRLLQVLACFVLFLSGTIRADEATLNSDRAAAKLARTIVQSEFQRVAVFPVLFESDLRNTAFSGNFPNSNTDGLNELLNSDKNRAKILASPLSKLHAEQMQMSLARISEGAFQVVASESILESLQSQQVDFAALHPHSSSLASVTVGDTPIDAIVTGVIRKRNTEQDYAVQDIQWEVFNPSQSAILNAHSETQYVNLAEAIYEGASGELFRWTGDRLQVLGYSYEWRGQARQRLRGSIPLKPEDAIDLYQSFAGRVEHQANPIFNDRCPYKVNFRVNGQIADLHLAINEGVYFSEVGLKKRFRPISDPYLAVEPGDELEVIVQNAGKQQVRVAVLIDGVNILGMKRELPDENCAVWHFEPRQKGVFGAWYSGRKGEEMKSEFVVTPWSASVAGKLGLKEQARQITVVVFTVGWPERDKLRFFPRALVQQALWNQGMQRVEIIEELEASGSVGSPAPGVGVGGKKPVPGALQWISSERRHGTILAAMTVKYAPSSLMKETILDELQRRRPWGFDPKTNDLNLVVSPTSLRYVP